MDTIPFTWYHLNLYAELFLNTKYIMEDGSSSNATASPINEDVVQQVIAELITDAPCSEIKDCIKVYQYGKSIKQLTTSFNQFGTDCLVKTLNYLHVPDRENYVKGSNVRSLICRIQNLLPDICVKCKDVYCVKNTDISLLSCSVCGQEFHHDCLSELLGSDESLDSMSKEDLMAKINPLQIPGWVYICQPCSNDHLPDDLNDGRKKSKAPKSTNGNNEQSGHISDEAPSDNLQSQVSNDTIDNSQSTVNNSNDNDKKVICKFYAKKQCKHGMKGETCNYAHPPICKKLLKFGHSNKGCRGCDDYHPKMCRHSLRKKECPYENCRFYHVNGTRYVPVSMHQNRWSRSDESTDRDGDNPASTGSLQNENNRPFLGIQNASLQSLRSEIMETLDLRFATLMSCIQSQNNMPPNLSQGQFPPLPQPSAHVPNMPVMSNHVNPYNQGHAPPQHQGGQMVPMMGQLPSQGSMQYRE